MAAPERASRWSFDAIGTVWHIDTDAPLAGETQDAVTALIERFDREWSRFRADSLVTALARGEGAVHAPSDAEVMLGLYATLSEATGGAVNPLIGEALARRGYDADYRLTDRGAEPAPADWRGRVRLSEGALEVVPPAILDVGALGKGRLVDLVHALLRGRHPGGVTVDAGGDIATSGRIERVALEHPYDPKRAIGVWEVADGALCASATTRRAWGDGLHHVLDGRTGQPVRTIVATWARADTAMLADAAATALFFDGGPRFAHERAISWVRMTSAGAVEWSPDCDAELFTRR